MTDSQAPEIITVASGKGGTGKTLLLASLGYALLKTGSKVLFVDLDLATEGLSHFLLGENGVRAIQSFDSENTVSGFLLQSGGSKKAPSVKPRTINRGGQEDHDIIYEVVISGRGLFGDEIDNVHAEEIGNPDSKSGRELRHFCQSFFENLRSLHYDYILVDTRGGFGVLTTFVCAISDSYFIVTEPTSASLYQNRKLQDRILMEAEKLDNLPLLRGAIVNKAIREIEPKISSDRKNFSFNIDDVERRFRADLAEELSMDIGDTYAIPTDLAAVETYALQQIPFSHARGSIFSLSTIDAFSGLLGTVTVEWSIDRLKAWNEFVMDVKNTTLKRIVGELENIEETTRKAASGRVLRRSLLAGITVAVLLIPFLALLFQAGLLPEAVSQSISQLFGGGLYAE
ncbi:MAG: ParA family protein [Paracoccaceae bacterium]